jgi:hypothetical protein
LSYQLSSDNTIDSPLTTKSSPELNPLEPPSNTQDLEDNDITMLDDEMPDTTHTAKSTCTAADTADVTAYTSDTEAFMQTLDHSQPWPREPTRTLPQDLIEHMNDPQTSGELKILLQQVPMQYLQTFYDLTNKGVSPLLIGDNIMPFWESSLSAPSANTKP